MADFLEEDDDLLVENYKRQTDDLDDDLDDEALLYDSDGQDDNILDFSPPAKLMHQNVFQFKENQEIQNETHKPERLNNDADHKNGDSAYLEHEEYEDYKDANSYTSEQQTSPTKRVADTMPVKLAGDNLRMAGDSKRRRLSSDVGHNHHTEVANVGDVSRNLEDNDNIDDEESDEDEKERDRFRSERDGKAVSKPARPNTNDKREIPDTLEISEEARQKIEDFDKQQREKKFNRQNRKRGFQKGRAHMQGRMGNHNNNLSHMRLQGVPRMPMKLRGMPFQPVSHAGIMRQPLVSNFLNPLLQPRAPRPNIPLLAPAEMIRLLGPPPPIVAQALQIPPPPQITIPPPALPIIVSTATAPPPPAIPVSSVLSSVPPPSAGNPIPTVMTRNQREENPKIESGDPKREVVFDGHSSGRSSPKLSVKISRSRSRSLSPAHRSSNRRKMIKSRRSRSPRSHSRSRRSPRRKSRRNSRSVSPKRRSYSPIRSASPKSTKPAKIHINPHFKGPRAFPVPSTSNPTATNTTASTRSVAPPAVPSAMPPPPLAFPPPPIPNIAVPPPSLTLPTPISTKPIIPIPPPVLPPPPGIDIPPPSLKAPPSIPIPPLINPSVPPPSIPRAPAALLPTPVSTAPVVRPLQSKQLSNLKPVGDGLLPTPNVSPLLNNRPAKPTIQANRPNVRQRTPGEQPVALIRPSFVDVNNQQKQQSVRKRLGNKPRTEVSAIETVTSSRLKPPPMVKKLASGSAQAQVWEMGNLEETERYKTLMQEQAERRKQILARKSRAKGAAGQTQPVQTQTTPTVVRVSNLAAETKLSSVERLMNSVAPVTEVTYDGANHVISGKFKTRHAAEKFAEKYDRYMLDLSHINVKVA